MIGQDCFKKTVTKLEWFYGRNRFPILVKENMVR